MIRCEVVQNNGKYSRLSCKGHAGYGKFGKDIVCASVSILVINTINSIEALCDQQYILEADDKNGDIELKFLEPIDDKATLLMDSFVLGMKGITSEYDSTYVTFSIKEVAEC